MSVTPPTGVPNELSELTPDWHGEKAKGKRTAEQNRQFALSYGLGAVTVIMLLIGGWLLLQAIYSVTSIGRKPDSAYFTAIPTAARQIVTLAPRTVPPNTAMSFCPHTVQAGEYIFMISDKYNVTPQDLLAANPQYGGNPDRMQVGDVLKIPGCAKMSTPPAVPTIDMTIPSDRLYTVASGDSLSIIALKFNVTVQQIKDANSLISDRLSIGQQVVIARA